MNIFALDATYNVQWNKIFDAVDVHKKANILESLVLYLFDWHALMHTVIKNNKHKPYITYNIKNKAHKRYVRHSQQQTFLC